MPGVPLAFSTNAFTRFTIEEAIDAIGQAGYDGIELLADAPHAYPATIDAPFTRRVVAALERQKLAVSNVNVNCTFGYWKDAPAEPYFEPSIISPLARHRDDRIKLICQAIEFARDVGARNVSITSGRMLAHVTPKTAASLFADSIRRVLDHAERHGIDVGIECEPGLYLEYVEELADWIERIGSPRLGANLDVGHCQVIGERISDAVRGLESRVWNLHVEGMPGRKHYHLVPGDPDDTLDWIGLGQALSDVGYNRFATVELYTMTADPHDAARQSLAFLRGWQASQAR